VFVERLDQADIVQNMSFCQFRMIGGEEKDKALSEFVSLSIRRDAVSEQR
jgi:hypothetical protein